MIEKIQHIRVKFLRLVQRLGLSPEDSIVAQVLHRSQIPCEGRSYQQENISIYKEVDREVPSRCVLYVDRLDTHARDLNDLPLLASLTNSLTASIWRNAIVTLTHAAAPPPDGLSGSPLGWCDVDSDMELLDLSDSDEEDEYDQLHHSSL
ncbi:hypothetical protein GH714_018791 [Hevea brasiliensis]|uniref:AIG1-type G domain-containing protein n=1 Tax=Hevea brasiliensis TaxID=3981 RepID=A0A6A6MB37_HEVBR|nr:hypothetical protein GH714_018791 [Hevea brasiliensis]